MVPTIGLRRRQSRKTVSGSSHFGSGRFFDLSVVSPFFHPSRGKKQFAHMILARQCVFILARQWVVVREAVNYEAVWQAQVEADGQESVLLAVALPWAGDLIAPDDLVIE
jgi:hypothetical protein